MALQRDARYPGRWTAASGGHPQGAFKNRTAPGALDGSYIEQDWANDWDGFFSSLLSATAITPNGTVDAVGASQYFTAMLNLTKLSLRLSVITAGSGNFTVPVGVYRIQYKIWGAGGGGGGGGVTNAGNGGSAGAYSEGWLSVTPGQVIPYVVGAGGTFGVGGAGGANGGTSSLNTTIVCTGGGFGAGNGSGSGPQSTATGGDLNIGGGAGTGPSVSSGSLIYGPPGGLAFGSGNTGVGYSAGAGVTGKTPGGGGGGGSGVAPASGGGAGGAGSLYIWG